MSRRYLAVLASAGVLAALIAAGQISLAQQQPPPIRIKPGAPIQVQPQTPIVPQIQGQPNLTLNADNWGFEMGLNGWEKSGTAFNTQPTYGDNVAAKRVVGASSQFKMPLGGDYWSDVSFPIGHKGSRWVGTYENHPNNVNLGAVQGDAPVGTLTSKSFVADKPIISFLIGGGQDLNALAVALYERTTTTGAGATCEPYSAPQINVRPQDIRPIQPSIGNAPQLKVTPQLKAPPVVITPPPAPPPPATTIAVLPGQLQCADGLYTLVANTPKTGMKTELMRRDWWNVAAQRGKTLRIRITDNRADAFGHINVDDFRFETQEPSRTPSPIGGTSRMAVPYTFRIASGGEPAANGYVDWDAPVWGIADLHTHPMSYLAFGKKLMFGKPDGDMAAELANCNSAHGGWGFDNTGGNYLRALIVNMVDKSYVLKGGDTHPDHPHQGAPALTNWPHFSSAIHQQMRWEWIKRAHEGGLRTMVALAVNNQLLADGIDGDGAYTNRTADKFSGDEQIQAMKTFVAWVKRQPGGDFLDIVYDPAQLRDTVRKGKLAVVLGIEVDNIGDFNRIGADKSNTAVINEIRRLHTNGVRYIFPVHVSDNAFGGAAIYDELFNFANRYAATQPLPPDIGAWAPGTAYQVEHAPDPEISYELKPLIPIPGVWMFQLRAALEGFEHLPTPFPNPCVPCPFDPITLADQSARCETFKRISGLRLNTVDPQVCGPPALEFKTMFQPQQYSLITRFFLTPDPTTDTYAHVPVGHRNKKDMTPLGEVAVKEMMRLGMIIDIDHMSEKTADDAFRLAKEVPGGYPLVSGHTGFRAMQTHEVNENQRSDGQLRDLQQLGGMMGIGWGYSPDKTGDHIKAFAAVIPGRGGRGFTSSNVNYTSELCAGTSRTFAQNYLYGIEKIGAVAVGSDVDGLIAQPGPRFGPLATSGGNRCLPQNDATRVNYVGGRVWATGRAALVPSTALGRVYDINVDGMSHYGLFPDFLQDMTQVGVNSADMSPLFRSADALASTWTKAVELAPSVR